MDSETFTKEEYNAAKFYWAVIGLFFGMICGIVLCVSYVMFNFDIQFID